MLLTELENHRTEVLVVLAGYEDKMEKLMQSDPGLARRFPTRLKLQDYAPAELAEIAQKVAAERFGVQFEEGLADTLASWIEQHASQLDVSSHSGGLAVNLTEEALGRLAERAIAAGVDPGQEETRLTAEDFELL